VHYTTVSRAIKRIEGEDEKWYYKIWLHNQTLDKTFEFGNLRKEKFCSHPIIRNATKNN
jgi:hypothetical protein